MAAMDMDVTRYERPARREPSEDIESLSRIAWLMAMPKNLKQTSSVHADAIIAPAPRAAIRKKCCLRIRPIRPGFRRPAAPAFSAR